METKNLYPNGSSYMITEQGDLGLGLTPISEHQIDASKRVEVMTTEEKPLTDAEKKLY